MEVVAVLCAGILSAPPAQKAAGSIAIAISTKNSTADLPRLVREQGLGGERHHERAERSGRGDNTEHHAPPLLRNRTHTCGHCQ